MKRGKERKKREELRRKESRKTIDHMIGPKGAKFYVAVFLGEAESYLQSLFKVSTAQHGVNEGAQFSENAL